MKRKKRKSCGRSRLLQPVAMHSEADWSLESRKGTRLGDFCHNPVLHPRGSAVGCIRARDNQQLDEAGLGLDAFGMTTNKGL